MHITTRGSIVGPVALTTVLLAAVTGCSSDSDKGDSGSKLLGGLETLAGDNGAKQVTFLDAARVRKLSKGDSKRFSSVAQPVSSLLNSYQPGPWGQHLKVTQIDTAVDTAEAGHWEGSFDAPAITKSLKSNGYTQSERGAPSAGRRCRTCGRATPKSRQDAAPWEAGEAASGVQYAHPSWDWTSA
ncbi:hypothetical protein OHA79_48780 (plasmid) [Streptomyces sp. NBC_00841]|uniref:hypothetical protein n=1 Tax=unclassified Streptomyces TaxID=2593676 RepID=UPI00224D3DDD|nr:MULTISPECIES: hypothetical protein [unclassified Streptomyces]MCX4538781.1 hypothetical protein [Streptomyces sp. NBC_01669]WSA05421.1 hypothetical protein OHA79_48780 [Streptomyces sp. NBC_00841]